MFRFALSGILAVGTVAIITAGPTSVADAPAPTSTVPPTTTSTTSTTTTTSTTIPPTTTTTTTVPAGEWRCGEWLPLAIEVGWPVEQLPMLDRVIFRESTCRPDAYNAADPNGGSRGLVQVNGIWCDWYLPDRGIITTCDDLFDPAANLRAGLAIWQRSGWSPWGL